MREKKGKEESKGKGGEGGFKTRGKTWEDTNYFRGRRGTVVGLRIKAHS